MASGARSVRVVGVGNPSRGDDGVGPAVAAAVASRAHPAIDVRVSHSDPSRLMERWGSADTVVLIDAMVDRAGPGTVKIVDAGAGPLPAEFESISSHGMGIPATVELARSLGRLPERLIVVGVVGKDFEGVGLSPQVEDAIADAAEAVMEVVANA